MRRSVGFGSVACLGVPRWLFGWGLPPYFPACPHVDARKLAYGGEKFGPAAPPKPPLTFMRYAQVVVF